MRVTENGSQTASADGDPIIAGCRLKLFIAVKYELSHSKMTACVLFWVISVLKELFREKGEFFHTT